ncbi:hypothetical protein [Streptomyces viridochromogenes]|uniref:hypothetical protein n=1 Tax=Streptomyces viridochromogenes TaxID=1938 RepID=UPI00069DF53A|nr:hypothetical protein [Streptomyces viridochromogenes]KOG26796.1 hypothetical protein ADK36_02220 [Streptomyces viridochromogenes]
MTTAPFLSSFLRPNPRNLESLQAAWARMLELGYTTRTEPVDEPEGCTRTRCAGVHEGYPGSEHRWALHCLLCAVDIEVFYSHMRERKGANPAPPRRHKGCKFSGPTRATARAARYAELGLVLPAWDADAHAARLAA